MLFFLLLFVSPREGRDILFSNKITNFTLSKQTTTVVAAGGGGQSEELERNNILIIDYRNNRRPGREELGTRAGVL